MLSSDNYLTISDVNLYLHCLLIYYFIKIHWSSYSVNGPITDHDFASILFHIANIYPRKNIVSYSILCIETYWLTSPLFLKTFMYAELVSVSECII